MARKQKELKPNMKFINKLKKTLRAKPQDYDQAQFSSAMGNEDVVGIADDDICGTECCIAGHAYMLAGHSLRELIKADARGSGEIVEAARKAMGLDKQYTRYLFGGNGDWPSEFLFKKNDSKKTQVEKACKFLDAIVEKVTVLQKHPIVTKELWD